LRRGLFIFCSASRGNINDWKKSKLSEEEKIRLVAFISRRAMMDNEQETAIFNGT